MTDQQIYERIAKWLSGNMTGEEEQHFTAWLEEDPAHKVMAEELAEVWSFVDIPDGSVFEKGTAWKRISGEIDPNPGENVPVRHLNSGGWKQLFKLAAVFMLSIAVSVWLFFSPQKAERAFAENSGNPAKMVVLPDGSNLWLNKNTKIYYDKDFSKRLVLLEGEAFFEVKPDPDSPFEILAGDTRTRVLGTAFNLRAYPDEENVELVVEHGKVAFVNHKPTRDPVVLTKGEGGIFDKKTAGISKKEKTTQNAYAWKTGKLKFVHQPLSEVIPVLERYFNVRFDVVNPQINNCTDKIIFENISLEEAIKRLEFTLNIKVTAQDGYYLISGEGCD